MIDIGSHTGHKIGILLILTTLAIGSAAGLNIQDPEDGEVLPKESFQVSVTDLGGGSYDLWYTNSTGDWVIEANDTSQNETIPGQNLPTGQYSIEVNDSSEGTESQNIDFYIDDQSATEDSVSPSDGSYVSSDSPTVEANIDKNGQANLDEIWLEVSGNDNSYTHQCTDLSGSNPISCSFSPDLSSGNTYDVSWNATDSIGNSNSGSWDFTVDTEYDGDDNPSFSVEDESGGVVLFDEDKDLTVDFGDADSESDTTVTCYVEDEDVDSFTVSEDDDNPDEDDTTCTIDEDDDADYYDTAAEIYLEMEDEAGNTEESDSETVSFDVNPPSVTGLEIPTDADLYNTDFDVEFTAFDSASEIEEVEYYFESGTDYGDGTEFDYSSDTESYEIDTSSLSDGDHTLYVRARDEADRWSSEQTVDFNFDPEAVPEISLDVPENISVTAGNEGSFDVTVENTGELHISSIKLSGSAEGVFADSQSISDLEPGESLTATLDVDTDTDNIGEHTIEVSTDNPSMTEEIGLVVEANSDQRDQIDSDISEYQNMLQEMETNVTSLKQKVSEDKRQRLDSNFSKFKQKVEDAQSAVDNGDYYEAEAILEGIDQDRSAAESTYEAVQKEYQNNQFWMFVFLGIGGIVLLGGGVIGGLSYTDEVDFDIRDYLEDLQETDINIDTSSLERIPEKIKGLFDGKDHSDAEDFEWEGFNNN